MTRINDNTQQFPSDWIGKNLIPKKQEIAMTERTITEKELREAIAELTSLSDSTFYDLVKVAFPPIFKPKKGEAIWASVFGNQYGLKVFRHMDNGEYVCFENTDENVSCIYKYAKPQTPRNKGE
jgi:predicted DNA-binding transcriptional regulator AlpA